MHILGDAIFCANEKIYFPLYKIIDNLEFEKKICIEFEQKADCMKIWKHQVMLIGS